MEDMFENMKQGNFLKEKYQLIKLLGKGAFSSVYLATDIEENKNYVIKEMHIKPFSSEKLLEIFKREAKVLANFYHPNIPRFIDFFILDEKNIYLVQEYIEGNNLSVLIKEDKFFTENEVIKIALDILDVLEYLHHFSPPIIHRDIKPENIIYTKEEKAYLIDFGAVIDELLYDKMMQQSISTIIGTQSYMSFEQLRGKSMPASDIYSLGLTLIFLLSHKEPNQIETNGLYLNFHPYVNVSRNFNKIISKMIEPDWQKRYQNVEELKKEILKLNSVTGYKKALSIFSNEKKNISLNQNLLPEKNQIRETQPKIENNLNDIVLLVEKNNSEDYKADILEKIAQQDDLTTSEQILLISVTVNKIIDETKKAKVLEALVNKSFLNDEIIKNLLLQIGNEISSDTIKSDLLVKLLSKHQISSQDQKLVIDLVFNKMSLEIYILPIFSTLAGYNFLNDSILSHLLNEICHKIKEIKNKKELLKKILSRHSLSANEQKSLINFLRGNLFTEEFKSEIFSIMVKNQFLNNDLKLYLQKIVNSEFLINENKLKILKLLD